MKEYLKEKFALTEQGSKDLIRASISSFLVYMGSMLPAILLVLFIEELLLGNYRSREFYLGFSLVILLLLYYLLSKEYDNLYNATYKESANLRIGISEKLGQLPLSFFSKKNLSDISQTIMSDVEAIEHAMAHAMGKTLGFILFMPIFSLLLFQGNKKLALAVILPIILNFIFMYLSKRIQLKNLSRHYSKLRENSESFQETIELGQDIKSFGLSKKVREDLYQKMDEGESAQLKANMVQLVPIVLGGLLMYLSLGLIIFIGCKLYIKGEINSLIMIAYLISAIKLKELVEGVSQNTAELFYLDSSIKSIKEIRQAEIQTGEEYEMDNFDIVLENVVFSYGDNKVIDGLSFIAKQGEVTALVGKSGCGKTSILKLISRLYDYDSGKISISGKDIKEISTDSLFQNISIVFQNVNLFNTSVLENIRIGKSDASDEEVKEAARLANCEEFIEKLDYGYDTIIGENGASLSGGERQRISIARAFLKDSPIIILDEIAASLDVENEKKIQESMNRLMKNKTVIIISHRLKSIEKVDKIVVLEEGKVESIGSHKELLDKSKLYNKLLDKSKLAEEFVY